MTLSPLFANICGFIGMACIILAYGYTTREGAHGRRPNPFVQHGTNLAGAVLLTVSLMVNLNPASLVLEGFWSAIALWGLGKALHDRRNKAR
ncbi:MULTISPECIES: permease [unclassified Novosphingobium]|uniref:CBU_0592 family membrane protein n=1 Tax=unclassified Novosphingobium TaxID=2644732 RepID=UPI000D30F220|nr:MULTISPECIES: permease [unclassified Novosphingobium]PTR06921.1 hypothetical protein C8K11_11893 [Novosphingobium sp. GV055]PUA95199.1 hypothetical protein C8K12_11893 [Novosphingobium sp. GV061]PUB14442.1 hypothetical protein C8K14_11893 [Novosphingobium sp. GV079]PUB38790.1 hypothetical protein C8K10_11893 [Novosphingobium sp. GV027]